MKKSRGYWARLGFTCAVSVFLALTVSMVALVSVKVNDVLHPPRRVSSGAVLAKWNIKYQSVDLVTEDRIRLSAWYTPARNGAVILLAHSYGDHRPEWVYQILARKGYGVFAWDARAHGKSWRLNGRQLL
jgi:pimeloyl-ACP methyl ester carboxylesterase